MRTLDVLLLVMLSPTAGLRAQSAPRPVRRWAISAGIGTGSGRSTAGVEGAMRAGGFDDPIPCSTIELCDGSAATPSSMHDDGVRATLVTIQRRVGTWAQIRAVAGGLDIGKTIGHRETSYPLGSYLFVQESVQTYAVLAGINTRNGGGLWAAAGPALFRTRLHRADFTTAPDQTTMRLGATVAAGFAFPARTRIFVEAQGQYRFVGTVALRPWDTFDFDGTQLGALPRTKVNFDHQVMVVGVGVRM